MSTIDPIVISDTFQVWINRSNEAINIINDSALVASTTNTVPRIGNVELQGTFTSDTLNTQALSASDVFTDNISNATSVSNFIESNSPLKINAPGSQENILDLKTNAGIRPVIGFINGANRRWEVSLETADSSSPFIIRTGTSIQPQLRLSQDGTLTVTNLQGDGSLLTNINASNITTGIFDVARIPNLNASKITSGIFDTARIPDLAASKITSGIFTAARIPDLAASKITSGIFTAARIPNLDASKITTGTIDAARLPAADPLPASATRTEISLANLTNSNSSEQGFITGRRFASAISSFNYTIVSGAQFAVGFTNIVGSFNDGSNYFDVFPPAGKSMSNIVAFIPSIHVIHFSGVVNDDDSLRNTYAFLGDRIRVYVQNTEQRSTPAANYLAVWR